jgi:hypothetical protein
MSSPQGVNRHTIGQEEAFTRRTTPFAVSQKKKKKGVETTNNENNESEHARKDEVRLQKTLPEQNSSNNQ